MRPRTLLPAFLGPAAQTSPSTRPRVDLHGVWERHLNGQLYDLVPVPSSQRPLGFYHLKRTFLLPRLGPDQRAFVRFDAVNYHGRVSLNGAELGTTGPYVPYEFEFTRHARDGANEIDVAIADLIPGPGGAGRDEIDFGLNPGWEGSGGIIRDAYVELRPAAFIDNVRFAYVLDGGYLKASCRPKVFLSTTSRGPARIEVALLHGGSTVAHAEREVEAVAGVSEVELAFDVDAPLLWSPGAPSLYRLLARLYMGRAEDEWAGATGFRDVRIRGRDFELNGTRLVLAGVCRHDMWKDQGFTLTPEQMAQDMRMIKAMGANFVRLAHYPHHRRIIELADELGLFVTEEPGHWNVNFRNMPRGRIDISLEVMSRAIRRDWNSPAVFAWLLGNECNVTVGYLTEGKALCNGLDPIARPVSFANIYNDPKKTYDEGGLDFYCEHEYGFDANKFRKAADKFGPDKPLVHTEWGWEDPARGQVTHERNFDRVLEMIEQGKLAGHSFWSWQDIREYTRIDWPTRNGILMSGVVDEAREPRERLYMDLARLFQRRPREEQPARTRPEIAPLRSVAWSPAARFSPVDLQPLAASEAGRKASAELEARFAKFWDRARMGRGQWRRTGEKFLLWQGVEIVIGGVRFRTPVIDGYVRPLVLTPEAPELDIPIGVKCARLLILGHVTFPNGYPVVGKAGEMAAAYSLRYAGGRRETVPLRNGIEVARANMVHEATRIDPMAIAAPRAVTFIKDAAREHYQALLFALPARAARLDTLHARLSPGAEPFAIFAITAEQERK